MLQVETIEAFDDNYIWLLSQGGAACAVVDPGDAEPVLEKLAADKRQLTAIMITHKHYDHVGGIDDLKQVFPEAAVYGPAHENIKGLDVLLAEGESVEVPGTELLFQVLDVPGHTEGHIAYFGHNSLFCGDTVFAAGCGRVFTGTFEQMTHSLSRIRSLPIETQLYCAHEYTLANLGFAMWVEPDSPALLQRQEKDEKSREQGQPTVPSSLELELLTNPFLRFDDEDVKAAAERWAGKSLHSHEQVFTALRQWKDRDYD